VGERVPGATQVTFKPLIPRKVWLANAYASSNMHTLIVSRTTLLEHYRDGASLGSPAVQEILKTTSFGAGLIANVWVSELTLPKESTHQAEFVLYGKRYLLVWKQGRGADNGLEIALYPRAYNHFETTFYDDLPDELKAMLPKNDFIKAAISEEGNRLFYQIFSSKGSIEVDDTFRVFYSSVDSDRQTIRAEELPPAARDWMLENPTSTKLSTADYEKFSFQGVEGYRVTFSDGSENKYTYFDKFGKNLYHYYTLTAVL
jgi:hypothetical protein